MAGGLAEVDGGDCMPQPGLLHLGHLLPLPGERIVLQYVIVVGQTPTIVSAA